MTLLMAPPEQSFAEAVQRVLEEHGLTLRSQRQRTGLAHSTILTWLQGVRPRMEAVIQFAEAFNLDKNEWLALAGYEPILASETPQDLFWRLYGEMVRRLDAEGIEPIMPTLDIRSSRWDDLTEAQIREMVDGLEQRGREKHAAQSEG